MKSEKERFHAVIGINLVRDCRHCLMGIWIHSNEDKTSQAQVLTFLKIKEISVMRFD